jgi:hypothetical protein
MTDWTVAFDDSLVMRFTRCLKCLEPVTWIDLIETDEGPRCAGLCGRCLTNWRQRRERLLEEGQSCLFVT